MEIPGYEIQRCIGQGGMASAYLATQTSLDRQIVLKVLHTSISDSPVTTARFLNEGRIVASLQHPNIITTYDIGTAGTDVFISMEFVGGGDLKQRLREQIFAPAEAVSLIAKIASALAAAHAKGIVHRDVKPGNILFRADGTPLLSDFGIAKRLTGDADLTSTGVFVGSPNYMAPEQSDIGPLDGRADIYALGVIFFEMLTGKKPYYSDSVIDVILMHKKDPVPVLPVGLEDYQEMLNLMMAKDRNDRFRDAESVLHYIERSTQQWMKSVDELADESGFDVTGMQAPKAVTRVQLGKVQRFKLRALLSSIALLCATAYVVLMLVERRMSDE
jgi:serine/threonine-protein kinase PpkA